LLDLAKGDMLVRSGVGVGLALPASGSAEMRGRQAVPLQRNGYRRIGGGL